MKLAVPRSLRDDILKQLHNSPTAGHLGIKKTTERVRARYYWAGCRRDVERWCGACDKCGSRKKPNKTTRAQMKMYNVGAPMERIAIDVMGPLPLSEMGNKYVLVISDYFSKWTEAYAMPNQEAETVARIVVQEFVVRFGIPRQLHTDQGTNFESRLFREMCKILDIDKTRTTPLRPQSDGMVERFNRTLEAMLSMFVDLRQTDWDYYLPLVMMAYRSSVHESTGFTPNEMMLGREVLLPVDLLFGGHEPEEKGNDTTEYAQRLREAIHRVHQFAREHLKISTERQKKNYDHRLGNQTKYKTGDAVWLHNPQRKKGLCPKLQRTFEGPYLVTKQISDVIYRIQRGPRAKPKVVHHDRLKPYCGQEVSDWLVPDSEPANEPTPPVPPEEAITGPGLETDDPDPGLPLPEADQATSSQEKDSRPSRKAR